MFYYPKKIAETRLIARDVSIITFWVGILFLIPMLIGMIYSEPSWPIYLLLMLITSGPGYFFMKLLKKEDKPFTRMTIITLAVTWVVCAVVGSYPFIAMGGMNPLDGIFESVASISTAGLTNIQFPEAMPNSVLFWRAMLAWFGGIGITAVAFYSVLQNESLSRIILGEGFERLKPSVVNSAKEIFKIYSFWTVLGVVVLTIIGVPVFDSFSISMNAISTTGADVRDEGWDYYQRTLPGTFPIMTSVVALLMVIGAISFIAHYRVLKNRRITAYWKDAETRVYLIVLLVGMGLVAGYLILNNQEPAALTYEALSTSTTGGFEMTPRITNRSGNFVMGILIVLALIGGCSNSAAGGLKIRRVQLLFGYGFWRVQQQISPQGTVSHFKQNGKPVKTEEVANVAVYAFIYCVAIILVTSVMVAFDYDTVDSGLVVASAQAGGGISPIPGWELVWPVKIALIGTMLFGRLEFIPLFALGIYALRRH